MEQPVEQLGNDYLFPMSSRLSYASSPESDAEVATRPHSMYDDDGANGDFSPPVQRRLQRASSDPSINTTDNIPGIPPYTSPPIYHMDAPDPRQYVSP